MNAPDDIDPAADFLATVGSKRFSTVLADPRSEEHTSELQSR